MIAESIVCALINRLRGWETGYEKWHGKYPCAVYMGLLWGLLSMDAVIGLIVAIGWALWAFKGWGDYFDFSDRRNDEVDWIDAVVLKRVPSGPMNDMVSMSLRGLFILPLFVALSVYLLTPLPSLLGLVAILQGPFYYIGHLLWPDMSGRKTVFGELLTGALHGMLLSICISL